MSKKKKPLTDAQYVLNPNICPSCRGKEVSGGSIEVDGTQAWQGVSCDCCGATWNDIYQLMGYMELKEKEFTENDWRAEVSNGDTRLGYEEWKAHQKEMHNDEKEDKKLVKKMVKKDCMK